jgi:hypothetical protein
MAHLLESECRDGISSRSPASRDDAGQGADNQQDHSDNCYRQGVGWLNPK